MVSARVAGLAVGDVHADAVPPPLQGLRRLAVAVADHPDHAFLHGVLRILLGGQAGAQELQQRFALVAQEAFEPFVQRRLGGFRHRVDPGWLDGVVHRSRSTAPSHALQTTVAPETWELGADHREYAVANQHIAGITAHLPKRSTERTGEIATP